MCIMRSVFLDLAILSVAGGGFSFTTALVSSGFARATLET
jgi:hypothetical protein